jgi:hypothetical protein
MIYLIKNTINTVPLALNDRSTSTLYDVLFEFTNDITGQVIYFSSTDISTTKGRYNLFTIQETSSVNYYQGKVELTEGTWKYKAYEMAVSSPPSLDVNDAVKELDNGRVTVELNQDTDVTLDGDDKDTAIFE